MVRMSIRPVLTLFSNRLSSLGPRVKPGRQSTWDTIARTPSLVSSGRNMHPRGEHLSRCRSSCRWKPNVSPSPIATASAGVEDLERAVSGAAIPTFVAGLSLGASRNNAELLELFPRSAEVSI